ncbi:protein FAM186A [Sciurus carolinensis]|uniref:protein FAM186A n=1 Tax=Sciurus carolinensis TaxID=30640 RepID=UPI001FB44B69|nr:protein FAM186A [Sciurus carolinensis]
MGSEIDSDFEPEKDNVIIMKRKPGSALDVPVVSNLEIPFSVQTVISRIEKAQLLRAREDINMQLTEIMNNVHRIITRYSHTDPTSPTERRKSLTENTRKRRNNFLEKVTAHSKAVEVRENILNYILAWLEEWHGILSSMTAMDIEEHHHWIAQMQMLPETLKAIENNVKILCRISTTLLEEKRKQKKRTQSRSTLWKPWKERVAKRPATAHALRPDQMISDQYSTNRKVSEIQDMLQELAGTTMFNKLENNAIKYISSTISNLSKALGMLSDDLKATDFPIGNLYVDEIREADKELSNKIIHGLSEQNEMLQQRLKDVEEKFEQLIQSKTIKGEQLPTALPTSSTLKVLSELSPQSSMTKAGDMEDTVDSILSKEFENVLDESQRKGIKGAGIKWDAPLSFTAQVEETPELTEEPDKDTTGDDISPKKDDDHPKVQTDQHPSQKMHTKDPHSHEVSESNLSDGKGEQKVSKDKPGQQFELQALEKKRKERKSFSQGKSKPSIEPKSQHVSSIETKSPDGKSGTRSTLEQVRKVKPEQVLEKASTSSEIKSDSSSESVGKEIKSKRSRSTEAAEDDFTSEPQKVETEEKKPQIFPVRSTSKEGTIEEKEMLSFIKQTQPQQLVKSHSKTTKEDLGSPDGKREQGNLELFQKAILAFLKEKIDNTGKPFGKESVLKEEKLLKKEEVEKLGIIKSKTEEYFQKVAETVTKILRKYKNIKNEGQVEDKSSKQKKIVSFMPESHFQKSKSTSAKSEISSILENESTDPLINNLIQMIVTELERERYVPTVVEGEDHKEKGKKKQKDYLPEDQEKIPGMHEPQKPKRGQEEEVWKDRQKQRTQKWIEQDGKENQRKREKEEQQQIRQQQLEPWKQMMKEREVPLEKKSEETTWQIQKEEGLQELAITGEKDKRQSRGTENFKRQRQNKEKDKIEKKKSVELIQMVTQSPATSSPRRRKTLKYESQLYEDQKIERNLETLESLPEEESPIPVTPPTSRRSSLTSTLPAFDVSLTEYTTLTPEQAQELGITLTPQQAEAQGITLTPQQAHDLGITLTPQQAQALGITLTPQQAQALGITLTPQQAQAEGITLTPQQSQAQGITLTPQQAQAQGITLIPQQAQDLGITLNPQQAEAQGITLTPQQAQDLGITLTPQQAQDLGITLTPQQTEAQGITLTSQCAQDLGITLNPQHAEAQGITLTPQQAQDLGITLTPQQAEAQGITLTPQQAQDLGITLTPQHSQDLGITLTPQQAQAQGVTVTPQQAQAQGITFTPQQAQDLGITLTPQQSQVLGVTLTPQQAQDLGITLTPQHSQVLGITLTPQQAQDLGITLTPQQAQDLGIILTPQQAQDLGITLTPQQSQDLGITLTPQQAQAQGITLTPQQAQAQGITLTPQQAQAQGITLTPQEAQAQGITLTPQQAQAQGITLTPQQAQAQGITLTPQQAQAQGITLTPQLAQAQGITLTPQQAQDLGITLTPQQAQAQGITLTPQQAQAQGITLTPQQAQDLGITLTPQQAQAQGITLTPQQAQAQGITLTPQQSQDLGITLTPQQAQAQGITLTPQQAQAQGITLTPQQAQAQGITLTPQQAQAQGISLTPQQAQAQGITLTPQQAQDLGISLNLQQAQAPVITLSPQLAQVLRAVLTPEQVQALLPPLPSGQTQSLQGLLPPEQVQESVTPEKTHSLGITLTHGEAQAVGIAHTNELAQTLEAPLTEEQARKLGVSITPEKFQGVSNIISLEQFLALRATPSHQLAQALGTPLNLEKLAKLAPSTLRPFHELKASFPMKQSIPSRLSPSPWQSLTSSAPGKGQGMHIPSGPGKLLAPLILPTSRKIQIGKGQSIPAQSTAPEILLTPGQPPVSGVPPTPGRPLISRLPSTFGQIPRLRDPLSPGKPLVPEASSIPRELQESRLGLFEQPQAFQPPAKPEPSPYLQTPSPFGQQLAPWIIPGQVLPLRVPPTPRHPSTRLPPPVPEKPQGVLFSSVAPKRLAIISSLKSKPVLVHPSSPHSKVPQAPFITKKSQISEFSDISEKSKILQDTSAMEPFETFQSYLTNYRMPVSQSPYIDGQALPRLMKPQTSLPSLITHLPKISQILPSEWDQKSRFPPINKPWILTSVLGIKKPKMAVPPSSPQELEEKRYTVDVEAQRKNLILLNQATKTSGLPLQQHTTARNLIIETLHMNNIRLGYLFRKYIAYRLIQRARQNIIKQLKTIRNNGKGYEMQNLYIMLSRIDDYQKKVMKVWTEKQKSLEEKRSQCLRNMMFLFSQLQEKFKLNLSLPTPLIIDKNQIPTCTEFFQRPLLELSEEEKKSEIFKKFRREDQKEAIWHANLSTSSYPITEKTSIHSLWAQLGGYPDIPRLLQLDIQSTFRKSLASIQSQ